VLELLGSKPYKAKLPGTELLTLIKHQDKKASNITNIPMRTVPMAM
jgi:hypothetical protein